MVALDGGDDGDGAGAEWQRWRRRGLAVAAPRPPQAAGRQAQVAVVGWRRRLRGNRGLHVQEGVSSGVIALVLSLHVTTEWMER